MNQIPISKCARRRAFGALLLALPLCGLALQSDPAWAQPSPNPPTTLGTSPLSPEQKSEVGRLLSVSRNQEFCKNALDLKLEKATIEDATARIKAAFPNQPIEIRQRDARPLKVSMDLEETTVGSVLSAIAALADCKLWVLPDGLLIAPPGKLNAVETEFVAKKIGDEWAQISQSGGGLWQMESRRLFAKAIAQEAANKNEDGTVRTTFGSFSPEARAMLQQIVNWQFDSSRKYGPAIKPVIFSPDSLVEVDATNPAMVEIKLKDGGASDPSTATVSLSINTEDYLNINNRSGPTVVYRGSIQPVN